MSVDDLSNIDELAALKAKLAETEAALEAERARRNEMLHGLGFWSSEIADRTPIGILIGNMRGSFVRVNRGIQDLLGYSEAELMRMHYSALIHPDDREGSVALTREVIAGQRESLQLEQRCLHRDGSVRWVQLRFSLIHDASGQPIYSLGLVEDITERKQATAALAASEDRYRQLVDQCPYPIVIHRRGVITYANEATLKLLEADRPDQVLGQPIMRFVHPEDAPAIMERVRAAIGGSPMPPARERLMRVDGTPIPMEVTGIALRTEGDPEILVIGHDISEQLAVERLKSRFVSSVSHELRTPLTTIKGYTEFLEDEIAGPLAESQREFVAQIGRSTHRLEMLVDDLLDFARINAGTFKLKWGTGDLRSLVIEAVRTFQPQAAEAGVTLEADVPAASMEMAMDPNRIEQVLVNLITNAIKFTPQGGSIRVKAEQEGAWARCEVKDSGIGIAAQDLPKLFHEFSQLDASNTRTASGTGLGLSICKSIIESHGGTIDVASTPGQGSTFWFTLPVTRESA